MKVAFVDTETTGLDPLRNGLRQVSVQVVDYRGGRDGEVLGELNLKVRPFPSDFIDDGALRVSGLEQKDLLEFMPPAKAYSQVVDLFAKHVDRYDKTDKLWFVAYNAAFDYQFMRRWWEKNGDKYFGSWFHHPGICAMILAGHHLRHVRMELPDFKLKTVASYLGAEIDQARLHDAAYDMELLRGIYERLTFGEDNRPGDCQCDQCTASGACAQSSRLSVRQAGA